MTAWHEPPVPQWFTDAQFQKEFERLLGATRHGSADAIELIETAGRICDRDPDSWVDEWAATAGSVWAAARIARNPITAREYFLRAATYYDVAAALAARSSEPERAAALKARGRACWEHAITDLAEPLETADYFFRAPGALPGEPRALVIIAAGSATDTWSRIGAGAGTRGHHWVALVHTEDLALPAALDAVLARTDVDAGRIAAIGLDAGSTLVLHTLATEHRFAAAAVDPATPVAHAVIDASHTPLLLCGPQAPLFPPRLERRTEAASPSTREAQILDWLDPYLARDPYLTHDKQANND